MISTLRRNHFRLDDPTGKRPKKRASLTATVIWRCWVALALVKRRENNFPRSVKHFCKKATFL
jgi:hypothetical protein